MDDTNGSTANLQAMQLYHCHGLDSAGAPQRWIFRYQGFSVLFGNAPIYQIVNTQSGLCLALGTDQYRTAGRNLDQESCGTLGAEWLIRPLNASPSDQDVMFQSTYGPLSGPQWCMAASDFTDNNHTRLVNEQCDSLDTRQLWNLGQ